MPVPWEALKPRPMAFGLFNAFPRMPGMLPWFCAPLPAPVSPSQTEAPLQKTAIALPAVAVFCADKALNRKIASPDRDGPGGNFRFLRQLHLQPAASAHASAICCKPVPVACRLSRRPIRHRPACGIQEVFGKRADGVPAPCHGHPTSPR